MREFILDKAPRKDLIPRIIKKTSFDDFYSFYKIRVDWYGYPLIHDRIVTYGIFDDLMNQIPEEKEIVSKLMDFTIKIAEEETDKRFLNSIFLISNFCRIAKGLTPPTHSNIERITKLMIRVEKLSFLPNMTTFWEQILYFLAINQSFKISDFLVQDDAYVSTVNMNFPVIDNNSSTSCPVSESKITAEIEGISGEYETLKFVRSAIIDTDKYWVWVYKNIAGNVWSWYFIVKQSEKNEVTIERHRMHGGITKTSEKLLLEYHYNSCNFH